MADENFSHQPVSLASNPFNLVQEMFDTLQQDRPTFSNQKPLKRTLDGSPSDILLGSHETVVVDHIFRSNESTSNPILQISSSRWDVIIDIKLKFLELPRNQEARPKLLLNRLRSRQAQAPFLAHCHD